jgi:hypothetical protein
VLLESNSSSSGFTVDMSEMQEFDMTRALRINLHQLNQLVVGVPVVLVVHNVPVMEIGFSGGTVGMRIVHRVLGTTADGAAEVGVEAVVQDLARFTGYGSCKLEISINSGENHAVRKVSRNIEIVPPPMLRLPAYFILKNAISGNGSDAGVLYLHDVRSGSQIDLEKDNKIYEGHALFYSPKDLQDSIYDLYYRAEKQTKNESDICLHKGFVLYWNLRRDGYHLAFETNSENFTFGSKSLCVILHWPFPSPNQLDLHVLTSTGEHLNSLNYYSADESIEIISHSAYNYSGYGPEIVLLRNVDNEKNYRFYVENVSASFAHLQNKLYKGKDLHDSQASICIISKTGAIITSMTVPFHQKIENGFFWDLFTIEGKTLKIIVHNSIVDDHVTIPIERSISRKDSVPLKSQTEKTKKRDSKHNEDEEYEDDSDYHISSETSQKGKLKLPDKSKFGTRNRRAARRCGICKHTREEGCSGTGGRKYCTMFSKSDLSEGIEILIFNPLRKKFIGRANIINLGSDTDSNSVFLQNILVEQEYLHDKLPLGESIEDFSQLSGECSPLRLFPLDWIRFPAIDSII